MTIPRWWRRGRRENLFPLPPLLPGDRRQAARRPLNLPMRLRMGAGIFSGHARDISAGGIGVLLMPGVEDPVLHHTLAEHERGAVELFLGDIRLVVRVRIAHVRLNPDAVQLGAAIDTLEEAHRLIARLEACGA